MLPTMDLRFESQTMDAIDDEHEHKAQKEQSQQTNMPSQRKTISNGSDDFAKQLKSTHVSGAILKPLRVFLSLTEAQYRGITLLLKSCARIAAEA